MIDLTPFTRTLERGTPMTGATLAAATMWVALAQLREEQYGRGEKEDRQTEERPEQALGKNYAVSVRK